MGSTWNDFLIEVKRAPQRGSSIYWLHNSSKWRALDQFWDSLRKKQSSLISCALLCPNEIKRDPKKFWYQQSIFFYLRSSRSNGRTACKPTHARRHIYGIETQEAFLSRRLILLLALTTAKIPRPAHHSHIILADPPHHDLNHLSTSPRPRTGHPHRSTDDWWKSFLVWTSLLSLVCEQGLCLQRTSPKENILASRAG